MSPNSSSCTSRAAALGEKKRTGYEAMSSEVIDERVQSTEESANSRASSIEFEMAYQARVAIDRIRFAIKHTEQFGPRSDQMREAGLQLLDALQRLETVDRCFQARSRIRQGSSAAPSVRLAVNGEGARTEREATIDLPKVPQRPHAETGGFTG